MEKKRTVQVLLLSLALVLVVASSKSFAQTTFTDVTEVAGVGDAGPGLAVAFGDYDNDGDLDIYVASGGTPDAPGGPNLLYRNNGDGTFTDVALEAGVAHPGAGEDVAFGDYDNDGDLDIYLGNFNQPDVLYRNNGDGTFTDVTASANIVNLGMSVGPAFGDYDNDSNLDIYVTNNDWGPKNVL